MTTKKVLVVEDIEFYRTVLHKVLAKKGLEIIEAEDGGVAVELFQQHEPDVVLMDVMLPTVDGFEATQKIRQLDNGAQVPIIFMTALFQEADIEEAYAVGASDYITKPLDMDILFEKLKVLNII